MTIYAVIRTGGKEHRVARGDVVRVGKLAAKPGATVEIRDVSSIETPEGITVGSPNVVEARVTAEVIEDGQGEKILIFKKKRRDHYQMVSGEEPGYTALLIREIAVGDSVYTAAAPHGQVEAAATLPPRLSAALPSPIELAPPVAAHGDAPAPPKVANEEPVRPQPQAAGPSTEVAHPVQTVEPPPLALPTAIPPARVAPLPPVEAEAPAPAFAVQAAGKRRHGIAALVAGLVVIAAAGLLIWGSREPAAPGAIAVEVVKVAPPPEAAHPSVPPAAKAPPRKEQAVKKTAAASAPAAPVQPPE